MGRLSQSLNIFNGCQREVLIPRVMLFCSLPVPALQAAFTDGTHPLTGCEEKLFPELLQEKKTLLRKYKLGVLQKMAKTNYGRNTC